MINHFIVIIIITQTAVYRYSNRGSINEKRYLTFIIFSFITYSAPVCTKYKEYKELWEAD